MSLMNQCATELIATYVSLETVDTGAYSIMTSVKGKVYEFLLLLLLRQHNCADMCKMKWGSLKPKKKKNNLALPPCLKESFPRGLSSSSCTSRISSGLMPYLPARNRSKKVTFINCIVTEVQKAARHECGRWPHRLWPLTPR